MIAKQQNAVRCLPLFLLTITLVACTESGSSDPVSNVGNATSPVAGQDSTILDPQGSNGSNNINGNASGDDPAPINTETTPGSTGANPVPTPVEAEGTSANATPDPVVTDTPAPGTQTPNNTDINTATPDNPDQPTSENPDTQNPVSQSPSPGTPIQADPPTAEPPTPPTSDPGTPSPENPGTSEDPSSTVPPSVTGGDQTGNDDDSPTETETASIAGPFVKAPSRGAGPPSVPEGLTLLMAGEDFLEFSWKPSTDDQSVESYEIYRDGTLVYTIKHNDTFEFNYRNWISTSYIDCNYTKFAGCGANPIVPGSSYQYQVAAIDNEGMKSALSAPSTFQLAQKQSGGADLTGYELVLNEEFDGESLDRAIWKTSFPWGPDTVINGELQYYVNLFGSDPIDANPFVLTGSSLQITGTNTPPELLEAANGQPYLSGVITTKDKFQMTYGYVEMKAKLTGGQGFLSTFYLFNQDFEKNKPEIDIIEYIGSRPDKAYQTYHYYDSNRARSSIGERHSTPTMESNLGFDLSTDFHTYGVLWEPGLVVWYIDGEEVRRLTGVRISDEPMNIIAQLVVGSDWIGEPESTSLPKVLDIDYIKAWQKQ